VSINFYLGLIAAFLGVVGYIPYFRDIMRGGTKPHAFSWVIWGLMTMVIYFAQAGNNGSAGSWVTLITGLACFVVAYLGWKKGRENIIRQDWYLLAAAVIGAALWPITSDPIWSVLLITVIDAVAYVPTIRKTYNNPHQESLSIYYVTVIKFAIGVVALDNISLTTALYPISIVIMDSLFIIMTLKRRKSYKLLAATE